MFWHLLLKAEIFLIFLCCAFGIVKGGPAERAGASLILAAYLICDVALALYKLSFPTTAIFVSDFVLAISLLAVAIRYSSLWLGCAMMLQSIALCSQGLAFGGDGLRAHEQLWLNNCVSMLMMACIIAGSISSWRRRIKARRVALSHSPNHPFLSST
jgi:hypothetical protein